MVQTRQYETFVLIRHLALEDQLEIAPDIAIYPIEGIGCHDMIALRDRLVQFKKERGFIRGELTPPRELATRRRELLEAYKQDVRYAVIRIQDIRAMSVDDAQREANSRLSHLVPALSYLRNTPLELVMWDINEASEKGATQSTVIFDVRGTNLDMQAGPGREGDLRNFIGWRDLERHLDDHPLLAQALQWWNNAYGDNQGHSKFLKLWVALEFFARHKSHGRKHQSTRRMIQRTLKESGFYFNEIFGGRDLIFLLNNVRNMIVHDGGVRNPATPDEESVSSYLGKFGLSLDDAINAVRNYLRDLLAEDFGIYMPQANLV